MYFGPGSIQLLSPTPEAGANDTDDLTTVSESHRQYALRHLAEAIEPLLCLTVTCIRGDNANRIKKGALRVRERNAMLPLVLGVLFGTPSRSLPTLADPNTGMGYFPYAYMVTRTSSNVRVQARQRKSADVDCNQQLEGSSRLTILS